MILHGSMILSDAIPHGTVEGFRAGCTTAHCPAPVRCAVVHSRYVSDWGFRRRVDAGESPAAIVAAEEAATARPAPPVPPKVDRPKATRPAPTRRRPTTGHRWSDTELTDLIRLHREGLDDTQIAAKLGRSQQSVNHRRHLLHMPANRPRARFKHGTPYGYKRGCRTGCPSTPSCTVAAKAYFAENNAAAHAGLTLTQWRARRAA